MSEKVYFSCYTKKEFADKLEAMIKGKDFDVEVGIESFQEFIAKLKEDAKKEFKNNLESIDEDIVLFRAYMLKAKESYRKTLQEECDSMYALWEEFNKKRDENKKKVNEILSDLLPIKTALTEIKDLINNIDNAAPKWQLKDVVETFSMLHNMLENTKNTELVKFVIENYKKGV